jgi:hypothetical protein
MNTTTRPIYSIDSLKGQKVKVLYWPSRMASGETREFAGKVTSETDSKYLWIGALTTIAERQIPWDSIVEIELIETVVTYKPIFVALGEVL